MSTSLFRPSELAKYLGLSVRTLNRWHALRKGPPRIKVGNTILYRTDAVEQWIRDNETQTIRK